MNNPSSRKKYISAMLVAVLLAQLWPGSILSALPAHVSVPRPITLVQDIHAHVEAQKSIQHILAKLQSKQGRELVVGIEGAAGAFDFSPYRLLPDANLAKSIADQLLEEGLVAGAVREGFLNPLFSLHGVENSSLYIQNVEAYRRAEPLKKKILRELDRVRQQIQEEKEKLFPAELKKFDDRIEAYRAGLCGLSEISHVLVEVGMPSRISVEIFLAAHASETQLNWAAVEQEKIRFLKDLANRVPPAELVWLKNWAISIETSDFNISRRFEILLQSARAHRLDLHSYPHLVKYVRYLKLAEAVNTPLLFQDLREMEVAAYAHLTSHSQRAQLLVRQSRWVWLVEKLVKFELSPDEWEEYKTFSSHPSLATLDLSAFETFYRSAEARNSAIARRIAEMNADVVVVGGFHTPGLQLLLESMGHKVNVVRPLITKIDVDAGSAYLKVFAARKTPLEKFVLKWKLFLAQPASLGTTPLVQTTQVSASSELLRRYEIRKPTDGRVVRRVLHGLQAGAHRTAWAWESLLLIPLAIGLHQSQFVLSLFGLFAAIPGLVAIHMWKDGVRYLKERTIWAGVFTGIFMVGTLVFDSTVAGLVAAASAHHLNHVAVQNSSSRIASFFFGRLFLPQIKMSSVPPENSGDLKTEAHQKILEAVRAWRASKGHDNIKNRDTMNNDPVSAVMEEYADRASALDEDALIEVAEGVALGLAGLNADEWEIRGYRDQLMFLEKGFSSLDQLKKDELGLRWRRQGQLLQNIFSFSANTHGAAGKTTSTARLMKGSLDALQVFHENLTKRTVRAWQAARRSGEGLEKFNDVFDRVWKYFSSPLCSIDFESDAATAATFEHRVKAVIAGWIQAGATPEELEYRIGIDTVMTQKEWDVKMDMVSNTYAARIYSFLLKDYLSRGKTAFVEAGERGFRMRSQRAIFGATLSSYKIWQKMVEKEKPGSPFFNVRESFLKSLNPSQSKEIDATAVQNKNLAHLDAATSGFALALKELKPPEQIMASIIENDFNEVWQSVVNEAPSSRDALERMTARLNLMTMIVRGYEKAIFEGDELAYLRPCFKRALAEVCFQYARSASVRALDFHTLHRTGKAAAPDRDPFLVFSTLYQFVAKDYFSREHLELAVFGAYANKDFNKDEIESIIKRDLSQLNVDLTTMIHIPFHIQILLNVYARLALSRPELASDIDHAINGVFDFSIPYLAALVEVREMQRTPEHPPRTGSSPANTVNTITSQHFLQRILLSSPWIVNIGTRMADIIFHLKLTPEELKQRIFKDFVYGLGIKIKSGVQGDSRQWMELIMAQAPVVVRQFHDHLRSRYAETGQQSHTDTIDKMLSIRSEVERDFLNVLEEWKAAEPNVGIGRHEDGVTRYLRNYSVVFARMDEAERRMVLGSMAVAIRRAKLTNAQLSVRIPRDIFSLIQGDIEDPEVAVFTFRLYKEHGDYISNTGEFDLDRELHIVMASTIEILLQVGLRTWKAAHQSGEPFDRNEEKIRRLFRTVRTYFMTEKDSLEKWAKLIADILLAGNLTTEELTYRVKTDLADESSLEDDPRAVTLLRLAYEYLLKSYAVKLGAPRDSREEAIKIGIVKKYAELGFREAAKGIQLWREGGMRGPCLFEMGTKVERILENETLNSSQINQIQILIAEGTKNAFDRFNVSDGELAQMYRSDMENEFHAFQESGLKRKAMIGGMDGLYGYVRERIGSARVPSFVDGAQLLVENEITFMRKIQHGEKVVMKGDRPSLFPLIFEIFQQLEIPGENIPDLIANAMLEANLTAEEYKSFVGPWLTKLIKDAFVGQSSEGGMLFFISGVKAAARGEANRGRLDREKVINELINDIFSIRNTVESALVLWRDRGPREKGNFDKKSADEMLAAYQWIVSVGRLANNIGTDLGPFVGAAYLAADLTPEEIYFRTHTDVFKLLLARLGKIREWNLSGFDTDVRLLSGLFGEVSRQYVEENKREHAEALFKGVVHAFIEIFNTVNDPVFRPRAISVLIDYAMLTLQRGFPSATQFAVRQIKNATFPGYNGLDFARQAAFLEMKAVVVAGHEITALERGLISLIAIDVNARMRRSHPMGHIADHLVNIFEAARLHYAAEFYSASIVFSSFGLNMLRQHPQLAPHLPKDMQQGFELLLVAAELQKEKDPEKRKGQLTLLETGTQALLDRDGSKTGGMERANWASLLLKSYLKAISAGDDVLLEKIDRINQNEGFFSERSAIANKTYARISLGKIKDAESLFEGFDLNGCTIENFDDVDYLLARAKLAEKLSNLSEARAVYLAIIQQLSAAPWLQKKDSTRSYIVLRKTYLSLAGLQARLSGLTGLPEVVESISRAFLYLTYDPALAEDENLFPLNLESRDVFLQAIHEILKKPATDGLPYPVRLRLLKAVSQWPHADDFFELHKLVWEEHLNSMKVAPDGTIWSPGIQNLIQKRLKAEQQAIFEKRIRPHTDLKKFLRETLVNEFVLISLRSDSEFKRTLRVGSLQEWFLPFSQLQATLHHASSLFALAGFPEEAEELLEYASFLGQKGAQHLNGGDKSQRASRNDEEARIVYPAIGNNFSRALSNAMDLRKKGRLSAGHSLGEIFLWLLDNFETNLWPSVDTMTKAASSALALLNEVFDVRFESEQVQAPHVLTLMSRLNMVLGRRVEAFELQARAVAQRAELHSPFWVVAVFGSVSMLLKDPTKKTAQRFSSARKQIDAIQNEGSRSNGQVDYRRMSLALMEHSSDPEKMRKLCRDYLEFFQRHQNNNLVVEYITAGIATQMVQAAYLAGPESIEAQDILRTVVELKSKWLELKPQTYLDLALALYRSLVAKNSEAIFKWEKEANSDSFENRTLLNVSKLIARRAEAEHLSFIGWDSVLFVALINLLEDRPAAHSESYHSDGVMDSLMQSPLGRRAYLDVVQSFVENGSPSEWKNISENKTRLNAIQQMLFVAAHVGDQNILYSFDVLLGLPEFPLKNILKGSAGLVVQMEAALTQSDWAERFRRMPTLHQSRFEEWRKRLVEIHGPVENWVADLQEAVREKERIVKQATLIEMALGKMADHYAAMRFLQAQEEIEKIPEELRVENRVANWVTKVQLASQVWGIYQTGETSKALDVLQNLEKDPVTTALGERIFAVNGVYSALSQHRLSEAENGLKGIKTLPSNAPDPILDKLKENVRVVRKKVGDAFANVQTELAGVLKGVGGMERLRETTRDLHKKDEENEDVLALFTSAAKTLLQKSQHNYALAQDLMHILFFECDLWALAKRSNRLQVPASEAERLRKLARAYEMRELHQRQLDGYLSAMEATIHLENNGPNGESTFMGKIFQVRDTWSLNSKGMMVVPYLQELVGTKKKTAAGQPIVEKKEVKSLRDLDLPPGRDFLFTVNVKGTQLRIPLNFVRTETSRGHGEKGLEEDLAKRGLAYVAPDQLLFMTDSKGMETLRWLLEQKEKYEGTLMYVDRVEFVLYAVNLSHTVRYLSEVITATEQKNHDFIVDKKLDRFLGLDISPQIIDLETPFEHIQVEGRSTPIESQDEATRAGLSLPVALVQGPPGTGKSHVLTQIIATAVSVLRRSWEGYQGGSVLRETPNRAGDIVVLTATSHTAVDAVAKKITDQNISLVRFASKDASEKINPEVFPYYENNLSKLWKLVRLHYTTGQGFVVAGTIMGIFGDRKCMTLLQMYLNGFPMGEIEKRYVEMGGALDTRNGVFQYEAHTQERALIRPVCAIDEAGQSNTAQTEIVYFSFHPSRWLLFGDHLQMPPYFSADDFRELFVEASRRGFSLPRGSIDAVLTPSVIDAMSTSVFELVHTYSSKWSRVVGGQKRSAGVALGFLDHALRSVWPIAELVSQVFYGGRLVPRQASLPKNQRDPLKKDTIMVLETDGQAIQEVKGTSFCNFKEAGMVIRTITYYLNLKDSKHHYQFDPKDLFIISPYKAQVQVIRDVIQITAILNDVVRGDVVSAEEISSLCELIESHWKWAGRDRTDNIKNLLESFKSAEHNRIRNGNLLLAKLTSLYDLHSDEIRLIRREFLPKNGNGHKTGPSQFFDKMQVMQEGKGAKADKGNDLDPDTIDSVQGGEKKVVIVSLVRHDGKIGFLRDYRLNVALSRAKTNLAIVTSRGIQLPRLQDILRVMKTLHPQFAVLTSVPRTMATPPPAGSLRAAMKWSTGATDLDNKIDLYLMPPVETVLFLSFLAYGLDTGHAMVIVLGVLLKIFIFPVLHVWAAPGQYMWRREISFSVSWTFLYIVSWITLSYAAPILSYPEIGAMIPVMIAHMARNKKAVATQQWDKALPVEKWGLDTLDGTPALLPTQIPKAAPVRLLKAPQYRFSQSGA